MTKGTVESELPLTSELRLWLWLKCISDVEVVPGIEDWSSLRLDRESPVTPVSDGDDPVEPRSKVEELSCCDIEPMLDFELLEFGIGCV